MGFKTFINILSRFSIIIYLFVNNLLAQDIWTKIDDNLFSLNNIALKSELNKINTGINVFIEFPNTEGNLEAFEIKDRNVLPPALATKYPSIHTYRAQNIYNENLVVNLTLNSQKISATLMQGTTTWDLKNEKGTDNYFLVKTEDQLSQGIKCGTSYKESENTTNNYSLKNLNTNTAEQLLIGDNTLRTLRTAITVTGEYSAYFIDKYSLESESEETQKAAVLGGIVASLNNLNTVFERDLGVTFELVANNDELIYLNENNDPFTTTSDDANTMINIGASIILDTIGEENFDIGHTLSIGFNGLAQVGALCYSFKADGFSAAPTPEGTEFDFTIFAHELGHQLGANHTQNYNCNRASDLTAVEPGSGSTIMGYAGACDASVEIQSLSDEYFHYVSILQIRDYLQSIICEVESTTLTNTNPVIESLPNYTIPVNTNFILDANVTDADADELTYCWEQLDGEEAEMPPVSSSTIGPLFRSYNPTTDSKRFFPQEYNTNTTWEVLPTVEREMNFGLTVRDGNPGGIAFTNTTINTVNTGEQFEITFPTEGTDFQQDGFQEILWQVAGTNDNGIDTENVQIEISYDNGETYEVLVESTPNNGRAIITVPNTTLTNEAKIKITAIDNIFYTIMESNFNIIEPAPIFNIPITDHEGPIFINPVTNGLLEIQVNNIENPEYTIQIYDLKGSRVFKDTEILSGITKPIDNLRSGVYILVVEVGVKVYTNKLLKL